MIAAAAAAETEHQPVGVAACSREPAAGAGEAARHPRRPQRHPARAWPPSRPGTVAWTRNAGKIVRKPPSPRSAALARRASTTCGLTRRRRPGRRDLGRGQHVGRQLAGRARRRAGATGAPARRRPRRRRPWRPAPSEAEQPPRSPAPIPPATPAVASPNIDSRAFAEVSDMADGSTRGPPRRAARCGPWTAPGRPAPPGRARSRGSGAAITSARTARPTWLPARAHRRPRCRRSRAGPITGASDGERRHGDQQVQGDVAALRAVVAEKKSVPARETAIIASPAMCRAFTQSSWVSPLSPAPSARLASGSGGRPRR